MEGKGGRQASGPSLRPGVDGRLCTAGLLFITFISIKAFNVSSVWNHIHKFKSFGPTVTAGTQRVTYVLHRQLRSKRSGDAFLLHNAKGQRARREISDGVGGMLSCQALRETHPAAMEPQQVQFDIWDGDFGVFPEWAAFRSRESGIQPRADLCNKCVDTQAALDQEAALTGFSFSLRLNSSLLTHSGQTKDEEASDPSIRGGERHLRPWRFCFPRHFPSPAPSS